MGAALLPPRGLLGSQQDRGHFLEKGLLFLCCFSHSQSAESFLKHGLTGKVAWSTASVELCLASQVADHRAVLATGNQETCGSQPPA